MDAAVATESDVAYAAGVVARLLDVRAWEPVDGGVRFVGPLRPAAEARYPEADDALASRGLDLWLREPGVGEDAEAIVVGRAPAARRRSRPWIHWSLALATLLTTAFVGAAHQGFNVLAEPTALIAGLPYGLALLAILGVHEMGHYLVARRRGVSVSLPYFIPVPFFLGTFGAFIRMDGRIRDRATYVDVAAAGPWAGLAAAVVALGLGAALQGPVAAGAHPMGIDPRSSLLVSWVLGMAGIGAGGASVVLGPVAFAGWLGIVVTALNLVPVGQLDGGHVLYALVGRRRARAVGFLLYGGMIALGVLSSPHWLLWAAVVWAITGVNHPPARNEAARLDPGRRIFGWLTLALFLVIVLPSPW